MIGLIRRKSQRKRHDDLIDSVAVSCEGAESDSTAGEDKSGGVTEESDETITAATGDLEVTAIALGTSGKRVDWRRAVVFGVLPGLVMLLAGGVAYLKWQKVYLTESQSARIESVQSATESTIKILSYAPDTVDHDLEAARDRLTGTFRDAYSQLIHDVVIPGAKEKKISAVATVPAATSLSASPNRAEVMVFVNQTVIVGNDPPSSTSSTVRITVVRHDNRWLISDFTPI